MLRIRIRASRQNSSQCWPNIAALICFCWASVLVAPACGQDWFDQAGVSEEYSYGWARLSAGEQIGDQEAFGAAGGNIYRFLNNGIMMVSLQGLLTENGNPGGNVGVVRRFWTGQQTIVGAGVFFDANQSRHSKTFQQISGCLELFCHQWIFRSNVYYPVGERTRNIFDTGMIAASDEVRFQGNNLVTIGGFSSRVDETAMKGIDVEIARSIGPADLFAGYYHYSAEIGEQTNGAKGGVRGYLTPWLAANVTVSHDKLFETNVFGGFTFFFGYAMTGASQRIEDKITIPVERSSQVVINEVEQQDFVNLLVLTDRGTPISITHVNDSGAAGAGTFENPHGSLNDASNSGTNIVYVHSGTLFDTDGINLSPNQRLLGEGNNATFFVQTDQLGLIPLLPANGPGLANPIIQNSPGNAITAGSSSEIANFRISNPGEAGIRFNNAGGIVNVNRTTMMGGADGIDILGGSGQFTFADVMISSPTNSGLRVIGGSSNIDFTNSSIDQSAAGFTVQVTGGHSGVVNVDGSNSITATNGSGLQFNNADGQYNFAAPVTLNGGDAGIDIVGGSAGTFTFSNTEITNPTGIALNIQDSNASVTYSGGSITQSNNSALLNVENHSGGIINFGIDLTATNGTGLQFSNADGTYNFNSMTGVTTLNGGDAGIDILGGSAGTFTFASTTTITNPTGAAFNVQNLDAGAVINYDGSIQSDNDVFLSIDTTAAGSQINFNSTGGNSLTSTDNPNGAIFIFDADGDITLTTPTTIVRPGFSSLFATDGDGTWTFNDMTITDQMGLNGGIDVFGNMGTVNFTNLNITTDSAGTGDATTGFLAGGNNLINVFGNSSVNADGGGAVVLININQVNMTWQSLTSTNNLNSQIGFAGDDGVLLLNVAAGTFNVTGTTTVDNADGIGISIENTGATITLADIALSNIGQDGIISGVALNNPGIVNINGGTVDTVGFDGVRIGSNFGSGVLGGFNLNNVTFTNIGGSVVETGNSVLSGSGNVAPVFSCNDFGGNTGKIFFNGGANSCPN